ncbi:MAG: bifunctional riboflavin kinase/FAD synthetase [Deltaproteobacteria bacterium]|nr:bifunctional riboflavin kinase/FAD synthetase [Deltaproteobacteria bacterium]
MSPADLRPSLVVIGNFDGVHQGHQAVLAAVSRLAKQRELVPRMLTFRPHPAVTLGRQAPAVLTTPERKIELIEQACPGIDVVVREFTRDFAEQGPEQFVERVLVGELCTTVVMVGVNFRFGRGRLGSFADLERLGEQHGFEAIAEPLVSDSGGPWSSTRVRELIKTGDIEGASAMLGRPHLLSGTVERGAQRGRTIGYPTCNLANVPEALPPFGVYAVLVDRVTEDGAKALAKGVMSFGVRPTVPDADPLPLVETHLFDVTADLYGQQIRVHLVARQREELRFESFEALRAQIDADAAEARERLASWEPDPLVGGAWA